MSVPAPAPFQGVEVIEWRLYDDSKKMARSFRSFIRNVKTLIETRSGIFFKKKVEGRTYQTPVLPSTPTLFIVQIFAPPDLQDESNPAQLLFCICNLYLLGFYGGQKWRLFKDYKPEYIPQEVLKNAKEYIEKLDFNGSYKEIGQNYLELTIGYLGQLDSYSILTTSAHRSNAELQRALCRIVVTISEALRFIQLLELLLNIFEAGLVDQVLDKKVPAEEKHKNVSFYFKHWGTCCSIIRGKGDVLPTGLNVTTVLSFIGVLLPS